MAPSVEQFLVVEGLIGGGKTELVKSIAEWYRARGETVCVVLEPSCKWTESGMLERFYADKSAFAYQFQTYVYTTRVQAIRDAIAACPDASRYILERSPDTDKMFMAMLRQDCAIDDVLYGAYTDWCAIHDDLLPVKLSDARHLYLRPTLEKCMERVRGRARPGEAGVTAEYQAKLLSAHDIRLAGAVHPDAPVLMDALAASRPRDVVVVEAAIADQEFRAGMHPSVIEKIMALLS